MIKLSIKNISKRRGLYSKKTLTKILSKIEQGEKLQHGNYQVSLVFCDDSFIKELNKNYRGKNKSTDVLSFSMPETFPKSGEVELLGEIYISLDTVLARNPEDLDEAKAEVNLLFCHGMLHLLGYTHDTPDKRNKMIRKQSEYLGIPTSKSWIKSNRKQI